MERLEYDQISVTPLLFRFDSSSLWFHVLICLRSQEWKLDLQAEVCSCSIPRTWRRYSSGVITVHDRVLMTWLKTNYIQTFILRSVIPMHRHGCSSFYTASTKQTKMMTKRSFWSQAWVEHLLKSLWKRPQTKQSLDDDIGEPLCLGADKRYSANHCLDTDKKVFLRQL